MPTVAFILLFFLFNEDIFPHFPQLNMYLNNMDIFSLFLKSEGRTSNHMAAN